MFEDKPRLQYHLQCHFASLRGGSPVNDFPDGTYLVSGSLVVPGKEGSERQDNIHFIGTVRNRVAHESGVTLRADELELFEEAARAVLKELDRIQPPAPESPAPLPPESPAPSPAPPPLRESDDEPPARPKSARRAAAPEPGSSSGEEPLLPPWNSPLWATLPGLHLIYAFGAGWSAFGAGQLYLLLLLAELIALTALGFAAALASQPLAAAGGTLFLAVYLCGIWLGMRNPKEQGGRVWYPLIPLANLLFFLKKIAAFIEPARLVISIVILGTWLAAIQLAVTGELSAAGIIALASWLGALIDSRLHRR